MTAFVHDNMVISLSGCRRIQAPVHDSVHMQHLHTCHSVFGIFPARQVKPTSPLLFSVSVPSVPKAFFKEWGDGLLPPLKP